MLTVRSVVRLFIAWQHAVSTRSLGASPGSFQEAGTDRSEEEEVVSRGKSRQRAEGKRTYTNDAAGQGVWLKGGLAQ